MPRSQLLYLNDIAEAAGNIRAYVGDLTFSEFKNDRMRIDAVVRNFEVIGEAVKNLKRGSEVTIPGNGLESGCGISRYPDSRIFWRGP